MSEGDAEEAQNAQSPTSADTEGKHESPDRNRRREYSSELGDESPEHLRDLRQSKRPREGGFRSGDCERRFPIHDREYDHR
jgi:hypothetical protein